MPGNAFSGIQFSKIFWGSMPPDPPRSDGLKPIVWVLWTHNRLLCKKLRLLKTLKKTLVYTSSKDFGRLRKTSDFFGRLWTSSEIFGNVRVVFKNPSTPRIKILRLYLRKSWQVYNSTCTYQCLHTFKCIL